MKQVLVIEDNADVRENICEILELSGYNVLSAEDGTSGLNLAIQANPDLILCDVMMPKLDGYGLLKILRNNKSIKHIPLIFLTARVEKEDFRKGMGLGADDYITKPFDDTELLSAIEVRLKRRDNQLSDFVDKTPSSNVNHLIEEWILEHSGGKTLKKHSESETIFREGQFAREIFFIKSGIVKECMQSDYGKSIITSIHTPGAIFGFDALTPDKKYSQTTTAMSDVEVYAVPNSEFQQLKATNRIVSADLFGRVLEQNKQLNRRLLDQAYSDVRKKVANALLMLHDIHTSFPTYHPSRDDLSEIAGVAKETLIRTLSIFKAESLIRIDNRQIVVIDTGGLRKIP